MNFPSTETSKVNGKLRSCTLEFPSTALILNRNKWHWKSLRSCPSTEQFVDGVKRSSELSVDAVAAPSTENLENRRSNLDGVDAVDQKTHVCTTYEPLDPQNFSQCWIRTVAPSDSRDSSGLLLVLESGTGILTFVCEAGSASLIMFLSKF
jgi:hypothetical protein